MFGILQKKAKQTKKLAADQPGLLESPLGTRRWPLYVITGPTGPKFLTVWVAKTEEGGHLGDYCSVGRVQSSHGGILEKLLL